MVARVPSGALDETVGGGRGRILTVRGQVDIDEQREEGAIAVPSARSSARSRCRQPAPSHPWPAGSQPPSGRRRSGVHVDAVEELFGLFEPSLADPQVGQPGGLVRKLARRPRPQRRMASVKATSASGHRPALVSSPP
jgi:hypothetical protein